MSSGVSILEVGLLLLAAALAGAFSRRFGLPAVLGYLAVGLAVGPFSFVLLGLGLAAGAITDGQFSALLAAAVLSIALSTVAVRLDPIAPRL